MEIFDGNAVSSVWTLWVGSQAQVVESHIIFVCVQSELGLPR